VEFTSVSDDKDKSPKKGSKRKDTTCFRSKNSGHYYYQCIVESKGAAEPYDTFLMGLYVSFNYA